MDEKELREKIAESIWAHNTTQHVSVTNRAAHIINLCREFFTAKPEGEEWWVGVSNEVVVDTDGEEFRITTVARKNNRSIGKVWQVVPVRVNTESPYAELIRELREASGSSHDRVLMRRAADALEKSASPDR